MIGQPTIREYVLSDQEAVLSLFAAVYPRAPDLPKRMAYDPELPSHVTTKLAFVDGELVGQANVFRLSTPRSTANLGYHVHLEYRRRGIALQLGYACIATAARKGIERLLVRTVASNEASIAVALRLGFEAMPAPPSSTAETLWFQMSTEPGASASQL